MSLTPVSAHSARIRIPRLVLAATLVWGALLGAWSVVAPLGEAPDEAAHLGLVLHLADGNAYPDYDGLTNPWAVIRLCKTYVAATRACPKPGEEVTFTSVRRHPVVDAPDKGSRPAWNDLGDDVRVGQLNQMPQHPPLYYQVMATVLRVERAVLGHPMSLDRELALLRLVNALLVLPLPVLVWWAARRFGASDLIAEVAALGVLVLPELAHIGSTLNNDNVLTLVGAVLIALLAGVATGDRSTRTAILVGVFASLALLTKAFGVVFIPVIALAYLLGRPRRDGARPLAIAGTVTFLGAGWWYIGVRVRTGSFTPTVEDERLSTALQPPGFNASMPTFVWTFVGDLLERFWGSFGWYTVRIPGWLTVVCTVALVVLVGLGLWTGVPGRRRRALAVLLAPIVLLAGVIFLNAWRLYVRTSLFKFIQGRYLFAGIVGLLVVAAVGMAHAGGRWAPVATTAAAVALQATAVFMALSGWWGGPGLGPRGQVRAAVAWSAWPGELVALGALTGALAAAWLTVEVIRSVRNSPVGSGSR